MTIGFRVKSGYAIAVVVDGTAAQPRALAREIVELSDPNVPETRQPHHDGRGVEMEDRREIARRTKIIERCANNSVTSLLNRSARLSTAPPDRAALVVGSVIDPETVGNPHIRAHAYEGQVFRTVLEAALRANRVGCDVIVEKQLATKASAALGRTDLQIQRVMADFGKALGRPWRTEEKAAATAAWMQLKR
jgi:hypothetical protein